MYSHRSFNASLGIRAMLALVGASAFQGSIKVKHTELLALLSRLRETLTNLLSVVVCVNAVYLEERKPMSLCMTGV